MGGILLVHGGLHGPWCWDDFVRRLTRRGHDVRAVELRGHDQPRGRIWHRVRDYQEDVEHAAAQFAEPPVLVGHSLGGLLVQRHLEQHEGAGAVLMASIPPRGMLPAALRLAIRHPLVLLKVNLSLSLRPFLSSPRVVRDILYSARTPDETIERCMARMQDESYLAFLDMLWVLPRPRRVRAPVLVLGAELDNIFKRREILATARAYRTEAEFFPGMGHNMMLERGWEAVADRVDGWVRETVRPSKTAPIVRHVDSVSAPAGR